MTSLLCPSSTSLGIAWELQILLPFDYIEQFFLISSSYQGLVLAAKGWESYPLFKETLPFLMIAFSPKETLESAVETIALLYFVMVTTLLYNPCTLYYCYSYIIRIK